jgi:LysR family transcriptional regulator, glycine cleavage system transcriptional activator
MKSIPPLNSLISFHAVASHLSFSRAAEELCLSHSALSQSVKKLEEFLGEKLFNREKNQIQLTKCGESYFQQIDESLSIIQTATKRIISKPSKKIITVNMLSSFAMKWLIPRIQLFQQKFPDYELRLCSEWRHVDFNKEDVDLALYYGTGDWNGLASHLIFDEELAILAKPSLISEESKVTIDKLLKRYKFLYVKAVQREDNLTTYFKQTNTTEPPKSSRIYFQNTLQSLQAAAHGTGMIAANIHFLKDELKEAALAQVVDKTVATGKGFYLVNPVATMDDEKVKAFRDWLLSVAAIN